MSAVLLRLHSICYSAENKKMKNSAVKDDVANGKENVVFDKYLTEIKIFTDNGLMEEVLI
jgi:hypothetical protein